MRYKLPSPDRRGGFTILEVMVAVALLAVIMAMTAMLIDHSSRAIQRSNADLTAFQSARRVFDSTTAQISQATLNTYWDYFDANHVPYRLTASPGGFTPAYYGRYSDLHFISGRASRLLPALPQTAGHALFFTAPRGLTADASYKKLPGLMSACGYFVAFTGDQHTRPSIVSAPVSYRWRLMELQVPAETLTVFGATGGDWFAEPVASGRARPVADNIIALLVWPRRSLQDDPAGTALTADFAYDSRTAWTSGTQQPVQAAQLPPVVQVTMVAIDEVSAKRMEQGETPPAVIDDALSGLFEGRVTGFADDIKTLEERLNKSRVAHHIFHTSITLKESKWSD